MKERLNEIIEKKGLTATRFAAMINANPSAVSHLLKGRNKPGYDLIVNIAEAFPDISMDWLLTGKGSIYGEQPQEQPKPQIARQASLFDDEVKKVPAAEKPVQTEIKSFVTPDIANIVATTTIGKKLKRIVLFFDDGSFEDYAR